MSGKEKELFEKKTINEMTYVSKTEEIGKLKDGTMFEVRSHYNFDNADDAEQFQKEHAKDEVKSISAKKSKEMMKANKKKLLQMRNEGDKNHFIYHGEIVDKTVGDAALIEAMEDEDVYDETTLQEALERAEKKHGLDAMIKQIETLESNDDENLVMRGNLAKEIIALYKTEKEKDPAVRTAIRKKYGDICEKAASDVQTFNQKHEEINKLRSDAGRYFKTETGTYFYSTKKKFDQQAREDYEKDAAYYDYVMMLGRNKGNIEKEKAIKELGIGGNGEALKEFESRMEELRGYHLRMAKEANKKIDLVKWYKGEENFLSEEPIKQ